MGTKIVTFSSSLNSTFDFEHLHETVSPSLKVTFRTSGSTVVTLPAIPHCTQGCEFSVNTLRHV